ncbi:histidinol dehydrogenase [Pajaroellobacter abortibovis]|nr:histidinol dehydrogenase [Pajaroellobacter abortibovis]
MVRHCIGRGKTISGSVREIIGQARQQGDDALRQFTLQWDRFRLEHFKVTEEKMQAAYRLPYGIICPAILFIALKCGVKEIYRGDTGDRSACL